MTRINIIPVSELTDQHLIAEYREITMVPAALIRTLNSKKGFSKNKISAKFTLNTGHVYFFYDKGLYLYKRYNLLVKAMKLRGFNPDVKRFFPKDVFSTDLFNDWIASPEEQELVRDRIKEKIAMKPNWYRKTPEILHDRFANDMQNIEAESLLALLYI